MESEKVLVDLLLEKTERDDIAWHSLSSAGWGCTGGLFDSYYRCECDNQRIDVRFYLCSAELLLDGWWVSNNTKLIRTLLHPIQQNAERVRAAERDKRRQECIRSLKSAKPD